MSLQVIAKPVESGVSREAIDENLTLYSISSVGLGGNWRLIKCNLAQTTPSCQALDTGVGVPSTEGHYNLWELLLEGDYLYGCWSRWSGLNCYRFHKGTGAGERVGTVAPGGDNSLNYHQGFKIKEDVYYYTARTGTGTEWKLWRFKGSPSQITDPAMWETIGYLFRDPTTPSTCPEGSINFSYCINMRVYERYITYICYQRCPSDNVGNFALYFFDVVRERLYNANFEEVPLGIPTTDPRVRIITENPPFTPARIEMGSYVIDTPARRAYAKITFFRQDGTGVDAIAKINLETRTARVTTIPGSWLQVLGLTQDGKVVFAHIDTDDMVRVKTLDPETDNITNIMEIPNARTYGLAVPCLNTEDAQIPITTIHSISTHIILPPNWQDGLRIPKRIVVSSPRAGQLRVHAQFQLAPANIRVRLWKIPDLTIVNEETLAGATSIDRTYSVTAGRYRVEVTAL